MPPFLLRAGRGRRQAFRLPQAGHVVNEELTVLDASLGA